MADLCLKCKKRPVCASVENIHKLCELCFFEVVEKRVRRFVRGKDFFKKNSKVLFVDDGSAESKVGEFLFNSIFKNFPLKLGVVQKSLSNISEEDMASYDRIIVPWNIDMDAKEFLLSVFDDSSVASSNSKLVKLLSPLSKDEIRLFAELKCLDFVDKNNSSESSKLLDSLEKKYPGTKSSIIKSKERLTN